MPNNSGLEHHYASEGIRTRIVEALSAAGLGSGPIEWTQLVQLDQFHSRGLEATRELAQRLGAEPGDKVLDLGSGFGGPARFLAATVGCHVTGIDLMQEYVDIATELTERAGLATRVAFVQGDASKLTFADETFDRAWTIHVSMNIRDKQGFYEGVYRVLRSDGVFALYDVVKGDNEPALYPAPWSPVPELSFLATTSETSNLLQAAGFEQIVVEDDTDQALEGMRRIVNAPAPSPDAPKTVSLPQVLGPRVRPMLTNMVLNFEQNRTKVIRAVARKPAK